MGKLALGAHKVYWGYIGSNGQENGNYYSTLGWRPRGVGFECVGLGCACKAKYYCPFYRDA